MEMSGALAIGGFGDYGVAHPTSTTAAILVIRRFFIYCSISRLKIKIHFKKVT